MRRGKDRLREIPRLSDPRPRRVNGHWAYWFFEETYRENIHLIWPVTDEQRKAYIKKDMGVRGDFSHERKAIYDGRVSEILDASGASCAQVLALSKWENDSKGISILAHECMHVVHNVLSSRGVIFSNSVEDTNEHYMYLLQSVVYRCHRALSMVGTKGTKHVRK